MKDYSLSKSELIIMKILWDSNEPLTNTQIHDLCKEKAWKMTTVATVVDRLMYKGWIERKRTMKRNRFSPIVSRDEYQIKITSEILACVFENDKSKMIDIIKNCNDAV